MSPSGRKGGGGGGTSATAKPSGVSPGLGISYLIRVLQVRSLILNLR